MEHLIKDCKTFNHQFEADNFHLRCTPESLQASTNGPDWGELRQSRAWLNPSARAASA
jgi:hypothetical protein